jgi:translation initiation factor eIF-2B subunit delta
MDASRQVLKKQPNMALLRQCSSQFFSHFKRTLKAEKTSVQIFEDILGKLDQIQQKLEENLEQISSSGAKLIAAANNIMTISHSTIVQHVFEKALGQKKRFKVFNLKSHPPDEGVSFAEALGRSGIKTTLIADAEMAVFMPDMHLVMIGADRIYENGFVNKAGTLPLCLTARYFNIPVYLVVETWKILSEKDKAVKFIERDGKEIYDNSDNLLEVKNLYFESIPLEMVNKIVCERGVFETHEFVDWYLKG